MPVDKARLSTFFDYAHERKSACTPQSLKQVFEMCLPPGSALPENAASLVACFLEAHAATPPSKIKELLLDDGCELTAAMLSAAPPAAAAAAPGGKSILDDLGDDEDSDDEEDANPDEPVAPVKALLRGFLKAADGKLVWSGNWADSADKFETGQKYKFRLQYAGKDDVKECMQGEALAKPLSGAYVGSFLVPQEPSETVPDGLAKVDEVNVRITFAAAGTQGKWTFSGAGQNAFGSWTLEGELDGASRRMAGVKTYVPRPAGEYSSDDDDDDDDDDDAAEEDDELDPTELDDLKREAEVAVAQLKDKYGAAADAKRAKR